jgi:hypothetical protein
MLHTLERALPPIAKRAGLLQPYEVLDLLSCRRNWRVTAVELSDYLSRPLDQVLHVLSYMTSLGLLSTCRINGAWYYNMAPMAAAG